MSPFRGLVMAAAAASLIGGPPDLSRGWPNRKPPKKRNPKASAQSAAKRARKAGKQARRR